MAVSKGKIKAGSSFLGLFLPFKFPLLPRRYAVYVEGKRHLVKKHDNLFIGEGIRQLAGHNVEVLVSKGMILAIRSLKDTLPFPIGPTCYMPPDIMYFNHDFLQMIKPIMIQTLLKENVIQKEDAELAEQWQSKAQ